MKHLIPFVLILPTLFSCNNEKEYELLVDLAIKNVIIIDGTGKKPSQEPKTVILKTEESIKLIK